MGKIRELPPDLVDKIAAGEVIERPASVVKELLENSLDAGARRIDVTIEEGGLRLIRVADDGEGIAPDDLPLAVKSHATSKVATLDDLFAIRTLGFRGEALASIGAVSRLRVASRPRGQEAGAELRVDGGRLGQVVPAGLPRGTCIEAADLFWNVPARRAFLGTVKGELRAVVGEVRRLALARTDVSFSVSSDGAPVLDAPGTDEPRERLAQLFGRELSDDLVAVPTTTEEAVTVRGYTSPVDRSRGDSQQQFFILNGRVLRDPTLLSAVRQSYANLLPPRRHPSAVLWLDVDPADVDVNVHPQKAEVRFRREREVFHALVRAVRAALHAGGLVAELPVIRRPLVAVGAAPAFVGGGAPALALAEPPAAPLFARPLAPPVAEAAPAPPAPVPGVGRFFQLHRRYVVEETPGGLRILDPHALHERILYEEVLARLAAGPLESQRFLFPQVIEVGPLALAALEERAPHLEALGFEVAPFGAGALAVHAAPRLLAAERAKDALVTLLDDEARDPLDPAEAAGPGASGPLHDLAATLACRAAVRFGDPLPDAQIEALLRRRAEVKNGHCCPHGRPTALALSLDELDRRFGRQGTGS